MACIMKFFIKKLLKYLYINFFFQARKILDQIDIWKWFLSLNNK